GGAPRSATRSAERHAELAEPRVGRGRDDPRRLGGSAGIEEGERGEDARARREPAAERNVDAGSDQLDGGALLEEVNGERRRLGEAALEPLGIAAPGPLEHEPGVEPRVGLELAHHQRGGLGARAPMDEPGVVAEPILAQIVEAMPAAPTRRGGAAGAGELTAPVGRDRAHGRVDENLRARRELRQRLRLTTRAATSAACPAKSSAGRAGSTRTRRIDCSESTPDTMIRPSSIETRR